MATRTPEQWAENILSRPLSLRDDYGNLLLSFGATMQRGWDSFEGLGAEGQRDHNDGGEGSRHRESASRRRRSEAEPSAAEARECTKASCSVGSTHLAPTSSAAAANFYLTRRENQKSNPPAQPATRAKSAATSPPPSPARIAGKRSGRIVGGIGGKCADSPLWASRQLRR